MNVFFLLTFILSPSTFCPDFHFRHCTLHFWPQLSKPALSSTLPFLTAQPTIHNIISQSAFTIFRMSLLVSEKKKQKKKNARSSFRTTGFYLWHNKDAPQSGVWVSSCFIYLFRHKGGLFVPLLILYAFSLQQTGHRTCMEAHFCQLKKKNWWKLSLDKKYMNIPMMHQFEVKVIS